MFSNKKSRRTFDFKAIVGGETKGGFAVAFRFCLKGISILYSAATRFRNFLYENRFKRIRRVAVPVVSVGNLTLGGTGKTPLVAYVARFYQTRGIRPGFVSRGYQAKSQRDQWSENDDFACVRSDSPLNLDSVSIPNAVSDFSVARRLEVDRSSKTRFSFELTGENRPFAKFLRPNDEARELAIRLPDVPHFLGADRFETATALLKRFPDRDLLILDDAFQHRKLFRNLDVVLLDALEPFGFDAVFPRGTLREPIVGLQRADVVLLSRAELISDEQRRRIRQKVARIAPNAVWGEICHSPEAVFCGRFCEQNFNSWQADFASSRSFVAFCGLGNPRGFFKMLEREKIDVRETIAFPDHHRYASSDFDLLTESAEKNQATAFLTTMKDFVKIRRSTIADFPLFAVQIGIQFLNGESEFQEKLTNLVR